MNLFFQNLNQKVVIWCISTPSDNCLALAAGKLPANDQQKAARFKNTKQGAWWAYVRLAMRNILGTYVGCEADDLKFQFSATRKPSLASEHKSGIFFNLSHCSNVALLAVTECSEVGIDIEKIKKISDMSLVAKHFFSKAEQQYFESFITQKKDQIFYEIWTQKESLIKANGGGLSLPLDAFDAVGLSTKNWTAIKPVSTQFAFAEYRTRALCLSEFGLSVSHKAAISVSVGKRSEIENPKIKMVRYLPEHD
jgi:4'-phosphopantetheinyl transferase